MTKGKDNTGSAFEELVAALEDVKRAEARLDDAVKNIRKRVPSYVIDGVLERLGVGTTQIEHRCDVPYKSDKGIVRCQRPAGHTGKHLAPKSAGKTSASGHVCGASYPRNAEIGGFAKCIRPAGHTGRHWSAKQKPARKRSKSTVVKQAKSTRKTTQKPTRKAPKKALCKKPGCTREFGHGGAHNGKAHYSKRARPRKTAKKAKRPNAHEDDDKEQFMLPKLS